MNVEQSLVALERANQIRSAGKLVKQELAAGVIGLADALVDERAGSVPVLSLLCSLRHVGPVRAGRACARVPVSSHRRVGELSDRQRVRLCELLVSGVDR